MKKPPGSGRLFYLVNPIAGKLLLSRARFLFRFTNTNCANTQAKSPTIFVHITIFIGQFLSPVMFQPVVNMSSISTGFFYLAIALVVLSVISLIRNRRLIQQPGV